MIREYVNNTMLVGKAAERPDAGKIGRLFLASDARVLFVDHAVGWFAAVPALALDVSRERTLTDMDSAGADTWTPVYTGATETELVDFSGFREFRIIATWEYAGTGDHLLRWVKDSDDEELFASDVITATGHVDSGWMALPLWANETLAVRWDAQSDDGDDDPVAHGYRLFLR